MVEVKVPRIRPIWWALIIGIIAIIPFGIALTINIIFDITWWLTGGVAIFEGVIGLVAFFIWLVVKIQGQAPPKIKQSPAEALERVKEAMVLDQDNPDNFIPEKQVIKRVGDPRFPRTPILHVSGKGSETNTRIDVMVNLDNPKLEMSRLDNATPEEILETIRTMAENPETVEVTRSRTSFDQFGRPVQDVETRKLTQAEKEAQQQQKEADEANIY